MSARHVWAGLLGLLVLSLGGGCTTHGDVCEAAARCGGGGDDEIAACIAELDAAEQIANIYNCDDRWGEYIDCMKDFGMCDGEELKGCEETYSAYDDCIEERERGQAKVST